MDTQKIGRFLKELRKEKGLTQEQLAEFLGVAGRTVSRWENASNMPDLSLLIQLADFYGVEIKEILDGERKRDNAEKELNETLKKVADYSRNERERVARTGYISFLVTFFTAVLVFLVQYIISADRKLILGETIIAVVGGITVIVLMLHNDLWNVPLFGKKKKMTVFSDISLSPVISGIFSVAFALSLNNSGHGAGKIIGFTVLFFIAISILNFIVLRLLSYLNKRKKKDAALSDEKSQI